MPLEPREYFFVAIDDFSREHYAAIPPDKTMFMLMLHCGLRVEEVTRLSLGVLDFKHRKFLLEDGKSAKDQIVYLSQNAHQALADYLRVRHSS
jgi:site-specific recombinase XerD